MKLAYSASLLPYCCLADAANVQCSSLHSTLSPDACPYKRADINALGRWHTVLLPYHRHLARNRTVQLPTSCTSSAVATQQEEVGTRNAASPNLRDNCCMHAMCAKNRRTNANSLAYQHAEDDARPVRPSTPHASDESSSLSKNRCLKK